MNSLLRQVGVFIAAVLPRIAVHPGGRFLLIQSPAIEKCRYQLMSCGRRGHVGTHNVVSFTARFCFGLVLLLAAVQICGCGQANSGTPKSRRAATLRQPAPEQLERGLKYLERLGELDQSQAVGQASGYFKRWLDAQKTEDSWAVDSLTQRLPRAIRDGPMIAELGQLRFQMNDILAMLEASWARKVSLWVSRRPTAGPLAAQLDAQLKEMNEYDAEQLLVAERLFDWTVRNIQLDELVPYPFEALTSSPSGDTAKALKPPPQRAVPGPGYQLAPWEALLYGHADAVTRARVFILLARQHGIDAVMLALPGLTNLPRPRPWLPAVLIGEQLYLFDTRLGLPIPGPDGKWVATLEQVLDDPALLSSLDVGASASELLYEYPVKHGDLHDIRALVDASPQALSRKTAIFEASLTGDDQLVLTVTPSVLEERLKKCRGVSNVRVWTIPFETLWFRKAQRDLLDRDQSAQAEEFLKTGLFQRRTSLARARHLHFRGEFATAGERQGAKTLYLQSRVSRAQIDDLGKSPDVQRQFGLERKKREREIDWLARLAVHRVLIARSKLHASYWVGLSMYDTGNYTPAITWLQERTLNASPAGPWTTGARYNLARAYEATGQIDKARDTLLADSQKEPQAHGNTLRARFLRYHLESRSSLTEGK